MRTRATKTSDVKISSGKNNHKIQKFSSNSTTPRNKKRTGSTSTTPPAAQNEPGLRNGKLLSPRRRAIVQTPSRDDVICSQHFDSQMVVGWDCNSPDTLRGIKRISGPDHDDVSDLVMRLIGQEADDDVFSKRNTPPLLGVWKEEPEDKLLDNNNVTHVAHRLRRNKGRQRRKSGKESAVSKDLLSKLSLALDKCSEVDEGKEEQVEGQGELFPLVEDVISKQLDCSDDLFNSESNDDSEDKIAIKSSNNPVKKSNLVDFKSNNEDQVESGTKNTIGEDMKLKTNQIIECCDRVGDKLETEIDDDNWSDDELFGEDSFIVKATQVSTDMKKFVSPVFGMKRKNSSDNSLPKSKCSRFSFQLDANDDKNKLKSSTPEKFTNLQHKQKGNVYSSNNKGNIITGSKPPIHYSMVTRSDNRKPPIPSSRLTISESKTYTGTKMLNSCANPVSGNSCATYNKSIPLTRQRTSTSSSYTNSYTNTSTSNASVSNSTNQQKPGSFTNLSFKKHNSFSGTGSQNLVSSRRRSVSGDKFSDSGTSVENFYGCHNSNQVKNSIARSYPVVCNTCTASSLSKYNTGRAMSTVSSTDKSSIVKTCSNVGNIGAINNTVKSSIARTYSSVINTGATSYSFKGNTAVTSTCVSNSSTINYQANNNKSNTYPTVCTTSVASSRPSVPFQGRNLGNKDTPKKERKRSSIGSFDTSISDDLLCQLAEPDDLLDSQLGVNITCVSKPSTSCGTNTKKSDNCVLSDKSAKQYKFKPSQSTKLPTGINKGPPIKETGTVSHKASVSNLNKKETVPALEQCSEDLFEDDDDDMLLADDDGLTEPQILAMLDEVEMLATQQKNNSDQVRVSTGNKPKAINTTVENNGQDPKQHSVERYSTSDYGSDLDGSQGQLAGSQGQLVGSQGQLAGSQGHLTSSPGQQIGSQGQSCSQSKYSPAEIERKKKEAIERRKLKLKKT